MKYFVSWTSREPEFQEFDPDCNVLVSPTNVPLSWTITDWQKLPKELFIDSGAFSVKSNRKPSVLDVLKSQIRMSKKWPTDRKLYFSHPDILIPIKAHYSSYNKIIKQSLERAKEYFRLLRKSKSDAIAVGVIQGFDEESILHSFAELKEVGYRYFGLGSLGIRITLYRKFCLDVIRMVQKYEIAPLHLFGITLPIIEKLSINSKQVVSFDTSTPAKLAFYGTVLYGNPLKRYVISPNPTQKHYEKSFNFRQGIDKPLLCNCPVCNSGGEKLVQKFERDAKKYRTIHNYFQIKWAI